MSSDVLIVGGGVIGLTIARELALASLRVTLLDQQEPGKEASWAGAGILPPAALVEPGDPLADLTRRTHALWPELSAALLDATGIDNGFRRCGGLQVPLSAVSEPALTFRPSGSEPEPDELETWRAAGVEAERVSAQALRSLEPRLAAGIHEAVWLPGVCQVRNPWHLRAVLADCARLGVDIEPGQPVRKVLCSGGRVTGLQTDMGTLQSSCVVIAAGAWSSSLVPAGLLDFDVEPVRGQIVMFRQQRATFRHVIECGSRYLVPREDGRVLVGATEERAGFDKRTTLEAIASLERFALELVPSLAASERERTWAGLRPYVRGGAPFIGPVPDSAGLYLAAGHFRAGLHLSPITARIICRSILAGSRARA